MADETISYVDLEPSDWEYTKDDSSNNLYLSKYNGTETNVRIPKVIQIDNYGYDVHIGTDSLTTNQYVDLGTIVNLLIDRAFLPSKVKSEVFANSSNKNTTLTTIVFSGVTFVNMSYLLAFCTALKTVSFENCDTSNLTSMSMVFSQCTQLTTIEGLDSLDTSNVTSMYGTFQFCRSLKVIDTSKFDTSKVTYMSYMFYGCESLVKAEISNFNTSNVTSVYYMFNGCSKLTECDVSKFDTSKITVFDSMFGNCYRLETLDVTNFNTSSGKSFNRMFYNCRVLKTLDLSSFDTTKNTSSMIYVLYLLLSLESITLGSSWSFKGQLTDSSEYATLPKVSNLNIYKANPNKYTGNWVRTDGKYSYTAEQLRDNWDGATMAGTYVPEVVKIAYNGFINKSNIANLFLNMAVNQSDGVKFANAGWVNIGGKANLFFGNADMADMLIPVSVVIYGGTASGTITLYKGTTVLIGDFSFDQTTTYTFKNLSPGDDYKVEITDVTASAGYTLDSYKPTEYSVSIDSEGNIKAIANGSSDYADHCAFTIRVTAGAELPTVPTTPTTS